MRCTEAEQNPVHRARMLWHPFTLTFCAYENGLSTTVAIATGSSSREVNYSRTNTSDSDLMHPHRGRPRHQKTTPWPGSIVDRKDPN